MAVPKKELWVNLSLINLTIVALFGFTLRSKILFPLPSVDYRNMLSAHSHFAFSGWVGLAIITQLIYQLLPAGVAKKTSYQRILWGLELSSLGMALSFPFMGYNFLSVFFSTLYIVVILAFLATFVKDILREKIQRTVKLLCLAAMASLLLSFLGPLGLAYILISRSGNSILYRDSIYIFLHFQYNGFFTLSVFALLVNRITVSLKKETNNIRNFSTFLVLSIIPSLFFSLLWHNYLLFYILAFAGCALILASLYFFARIVNTTDWKILYSLRLARSLMFLSTISFFIKMLLQTGTVIPALGNAVYGDRPVIIGFLHLVFLGFVSFFLLSTYIEQGYFTNRKKRTYAFPFLLFAIAVILNETLLMIQGFSILFQSNSQVFNWLLWIASILLFLGALSLVISRAYAVYRNPNDIRI